MSAPTPSKPGFMQQFAQARAEIHRLKTAAPYLLPEWQELEAAKAHLKAAQERLLEAEAAWNAL